MEKDFNIEKLIHSGVISNELEYERAIVADRKLRLLAKEDSKYKVQRKQLRLLIQDYESKNWSNIDDITDEQIQEIETIELIAEYERQFLEKRKKIIRDALRKHNLKQKDLAKLLGHKSVTHMSELMNGLKPFTQQDLIIISRLFRIEITKLLPLIIPLEEQKRIKEVIELLALDLKIRKDDLVRV